MTVRKYEEFFNNIQSLSKRKRGGRKVFLINIFLSYHKNGKKKFIHDTISFAKFSLFCLYHLRLENVGNVTISLCCRRFFWKKKKKKVKIEAASNERANWEISTMKSNFLISHYWLLPTAYCSSSSSLSFQFLPCCYIYIFCHLLKKIV